MGLEEIVPAFALIAVLILVLPSFIQSNIKKKIFLKNSGSTRIKTANKKIAGTISSNPIP